jgi:hypothetical protein
MIRPCEAPQYAPRPTPSFSITLLYMIVWLCASAFIIKPMLHTPVPLGHQTASTPFSLTYVFTVVRVARGRAGVFSSVLHSHSVFSVC